MKAKNTLKLKKKQKEVKVFIFNSHISHNNFEYKLISNSNRVYHTLTSIKLYEVLSKLYKRGFKNEK